MKTITELKKEYMKIRIKGNTRLFTIKEINKMELLKAQLSTLIEAHKEELEFLKKGQETSLGYGIGEFESMYDWNLVIDWIGKRIKKLEME